MATKLKHNKAYDVSFVLHGVTDAVTLTGSEAESFWTQFISGKKTIFVESHDTSTHVTTTKAYPYHAIINVETTATPDDVEIEIC